MASSVSDQTIHKSVAHLGGRRVDCFAALAMTAVRGFVFGNGSAPCGIMVAVGGRRREGAA